MKKTLRFAALVGAAALAACDPPPPVRLPGAVKDLRLVVKVADLSSAERARIGSFALSLFRDGEALPDVPLVYGSDGSISFLEEPTDLPTTGALSARLRAADLTGAPLPIGGAAGPVDLDAVEGGGSVDLRVIVGRLDAPTALREPLAVPRFLHEAVALPGGGLLVVGGATAGDADAPQAYAASSEWIDLFAGRACDDGDPACAFGDAPPPRVGHVAIALADAFGPLCPARGAALVGLGRDEDGAVLDDLRLFDPAGLDGAGAYARLDLDVRGRVDARAIATRDCRVLLVGGVDAQGAPVPFVDVIRFDAAGAVVVDEAPDPSPAADPAVFALANALDEHVVAGGRVAGGPSSSGVVWALAGGDVAACALDDASCNGAPAALACARAAPEAVRVAHASDAAPALVVGGDVDGACAAAGRSAELFRASTDAPYASFAPTSDQPDVARARGHVVLAYGAGGAVVVGGVGLDSSLLSDVEAFAIDDDARDGAFRALGPLPQPRAYADGATVGGAAVVVGGLSSAGPSSSLDVLVPER